jgi:hypothetical protein
MKNRSEIFNLLLVTSSATLLVHLIVSLYIGSLDNIALINLGVILIEFFIFFSIFYAALNCLSIRNIILNSLYLKLIFFIIAILYFFYFNNSFFQHASFGDDRHYYYLVNYYDSLSSLVDNEQDFYGLPFAVILMLFDSILPDIEFYRIINIGISILSIYIFYLLLRNIFKDEYLIKIAALMFAFNVIVMIFSSLFYKDIVLLFFFVSFLYLSSKSRLSLLNYVLLTVVIFGTFQFRYFLGFIELFILFSLFMVKEKSFFKKLSSLLIGLIFIGFFVAVFEDKTDSIISIFDFYESRISNVSLLLTSDFELSYSKLLLAAILFLDVPSMNILHYDTEWYVIEGLMGFGRIINSAIAVFMYIGLYVLIFKRAYINNKIIYIYLWAFLLILLGMSLTGQVLVDRQKIMLYPFVYIFAYVSFSYFCSCRVNFYYLFAIFFTIKIVAQIVYALTRGQLYV